METGKGGETSGSETPQEKLGQAEELAMFRRGPMVIFKWRDGEGWPIEFVSENTEQLFGYRPSELVGELFTNLIHEEDLEGMIKENEPFYSEGVECLEIGPYRLRQKSGGHLWVQETSSAVRDETGKITHFLGYLVDITERVQAEQELDAANQQLDAANQQLEAQNQELEAYVQQLEALEQQLKAEIKEREDREQELQELTKEYETIFQGVDDGIFLADVERSGDEFRFSYRRFNASEEALVGVDSDKVSGLTPSDVFGPDQAEKICADYARCVKKGETITYEEKLTVKTGEKDFRITLSPVYRDHQVEQIVGIVRDITESKQRERRLEELLTDKENLLREVYHRVGNNLQVITSLLRLQQFELGEEISPALQEAFDSTRRRIETMSTVHDHALSGHTRDNVEAQKFLKELCSNIISLSDFHSEVAIDCKLTEEIYLDLDSAVYLGLFCNEILGFFLPEITGSDEFVRVGLEMDTVSDTEDCRLQIEFDHPGSLQKLFEKFEKSLAGRLAHTLVADQLTGEIHFNPGDNLLSAVFKRRCN